MNHLCNSHCEFCGTSLVDDYTQHESDNEIRGNDTGPYTLFALQLVGTQTKMPSLLDYGFQGDFTCSVCWACASQLLVSDKTSYSWQKCHCCGLDTRKDDISTFRLVEVEANGVEQHPYNRDIYEFISGDVFTQRGPVGHTVCMSCVLPEIISASDTREEIMRDVLAEAISEGDVLEDHEEMVSGGL